MFSNYTFDYIMNSLLSRIPDTLDKREGSIIYDALAPSAVELANYYINLDMVVSECFADTASYTYLIKRALERGIKPKEATYSIVKGVFTPTTLEINIGSRFNLNELNYTVTEKLSNGTYKLKCETAGTKANSYIGDITPIDYIDGLKTARISEILIPGENEEDTEVFRKRYYNSFDSQAFGGNIADYKEKTNAIDGVGGVKVIPTWNGGGTVKLIIINSEFKTPSEELIDTVQTIIDPLVNQGQGKGLAPIGHKVTVEGVVSEEISIETTITYDIGYSFEECKIEIESVIDDYLLELAKTWENSNSIVVRISQIESRLLNVTGVIDISGTKINGLEENYILESNKIAVRGGVVG